MLSRFHLIPERHGQTDRQTDNAISISRVSVLTRDKNQSFDYRPSLYRPILLALCNLSLNEASLDIRQPIILRL